MTFMRENVADFHPEKNVSYYVSQQNVTSTKQTVTFMDRLLQTEYAKHIGITINSKLSWEDHITKTVTKANTTRAFLQRNIRACPKDIRTKCYSTLVRPIVEYAGTVCDPHVYICVSILPIHQQCNNHDACSWL